MEWDQEARDLLDELVKPIPIFARPMAKKGIESKILAAANEKVTRDSVVKGYLIASPGNMQERAVKMLKAKGIDLSAYEELLQEYK